MIEKRKGPCPMAVGTEAKRSYQFNYSRKLKEKQDMKEFIKEAVGAVLVTLGMMLIVVLMLIVG